MKNIRPMGATGTTKEKIEAAYINPDYVAEKKFDGSRYVIQIDNKRNIQLTSRSLSVKGGMCDKTDRVPQIIEDIKKISKEIILDGEIDILEGRNFHYVQGCMGSLFERAIQIQKEEQMLYYKCFDILEYKGEDLRNRPLRERRKILEELFKENKFKYIKLVEQVKDERGKRELFDIEIENGSEGIILKNLNSIYLEDKRPSNTWLKVKLTQTYDGIITGYHLGTGKYTGMIGSLIVSQYLNGELVEVADCGGIKDELREELKKRIDKGEKIIITFKAQEIETAHNRYRHPRFSHIRLDKPEKECIYGQT